MRFHSLILASLWLLIVTGCNSPQPQSLEARLQGAWRSNRDETIAAWKREGVIEPKVIEAFSKDVLGKLKVTYSGLRVTSVMDGMNEVETYRVVESGKDYVVIDQFSNVYKRVFRSRIRFVNDGYWVSNDEILKGYTEKFDRTVP